VVAPLGIDRPVVSPHAVIVAATVSRVCAASPERCLTPGQGSVRPAA
jgi:hypothetical protein